MRYNSSILYQFLCFLLFLSFRDTLSSSSATQICSPDESAALLQFKTFFSLKKSASEHCENRSFPKINSWKEGIDCCSWDGVSCDNITGQVIGLDLSCSWLSGTLHSNSSLFHLSHLQRLDLSYNDFKKSKISSNFGLFTSLTHLDLSRSWFSGTVPHEISYLSKLVLLDLSFGSDIEISDVQAFEPILKLEKPTLTGIVRNLTEVREIFLDGIDMSSVDPNSFMNLSYSLTSLRLSSCDLHGKFPEHGFNLPHIKFLSLDSNPSLTGQFPKSNWSGPLEILLASSTSFSGDLPESIGNLKSLLGLGLVGCKFSGSIPRSLGNLSQLFYLFLSFNNFSGKIPSSLTNLTQLRVLDISFNQLEGSIPDNPNASPNLGGLDLSHNLLSGTIPSWIYTHPRLFSLNLGNNQFIGSIPSSIAKLVNLISLDLSSNKLNGTISLDMLSKLQKLINLDLSSNTDLSLSSNNSVNFVLPNLNYVRLKSCNISEFPYFLEGSKFLKTLDLSNNRIHGQISKFPWKDIEFLDLHSNLIQGDLPILPRNIRFLSFSNNNLTGEISDICDLKFLEILDLSHNNFRGIIPRCIGSFSQGLSSLNLKMNMFHGIIPPTFAKGCGLQNLNLNSNQLEGPVTQSISNCKDLKVLDLGNNKINDAFPDWIETLPELQVLVLHSNKFQGPIGAARNPRSLPKLRVIDLSYNNLFGPLPTSYIAKFRGMINLDEGKGVSYMKTNYSYEYSVNLVVKGVETEFVKILTIFTSIDLSHNNFEGEIPTTFGELSSLRGLSLAHNNLVGHIPSSLGNLTRLEWLDLSCNKLGGQIPRELVDLTFLSFFNVSYNQLVGPIPEGKQFNTFENGSYERNEGLCGFPLSRGCSSNKPQQPPSWMHSHEEDDSKLVFGWKVVAIGYGFGFIFGVAMGFVALRMGKPKWFVTLIG